MGSDAAAKEENEKMEKATSKDRTLRTCQQIWKTAVATGLENHNENHNWPITTKGNAKECSNYSTIALISHASQVMVNILQARLQQYVNWEVPEVQAGFRKAEEPEIKLPISIGSYKKQENSRKRSTSASLTIPNFCLWDHKKLWNILEEMGIPDHLYLPPEKSGCSSKATVRTGIETMN